jgi:hypothetical protein
MTFKQSLFYKYKYKDTGTINGVNDMTKMIGKVETKKISNMEWGANCQHQFKTDPFSA